MLDAKQLAALEAFSKVYQGQIIPSCPLESKKIHKRYQVFQHLSETSVSNIPRDNIAFSFKNDELIHADGGNNPLFLPERIAKRLINLDTTDLGYYKSYQVDESLASAICNTYQGLNYLPENINLEGNLIKDVSQQESPLYVTYGEGSTILFDTTIQSLVESDQDIVIVPTPTYGYFSKIIGNHCKVAPLVLNREDNFQINENALSSLIKVLNQKIYNDLCCTLGFKMSYLGKLRDESTLDHHAWNKLNTMLVKVISDTNLDTIEPKINQYNDMLNSIEIQSQINKQSRNFLRFPVVPRVRAFLFINPMVPTGIICQQSKVDRIAEVLLQHRIAPIEDITHAGINLKSPATPAGTFLKSPICFETIFIDSCSKWSSLPGSTAAIAISNRNMITKMVGHLKTICPNFNALSQKTLEVMYHLSKKERVNRNEYLFKHYKLRLEMLKSIVLGKAHIDPDYKETVLRKLNRIFIDLKVNTEEALEGIKGLTLSTEPEAGLFVLLDFTNFVNQYLGDIQLKNSFHIANAIFLLANVDTIPNILCYDDRPFIRFSLSLDTEGELVEALLRMKSLLNSCNAEPLFNPIPKQEAMPHPAIGEKRERVTDPKIVEVIDLDSDEEIVPSAKRTKPSEPIVAPKPASKVNGSERRDSVKNEQPRWPFNFNPGPLVIPTLGAPLRPQPQGQFYFYPVSNQMPQHQPPQVIRSPNTPSPAQDKNILRRKL